jgi:hypothetical protein
MYEMWDDPCDGKRTWYPIKENDNDNEISSHVIQSYEPDLTVVIGTEEFKCHKVILSFASSTLDSLVATSSGRVEITHMNLDSDSWEEFYRCVDSSINGAIIDEALGLDDFSRSMVRRIQHNKTSLDFSQYHHHSVRLDQRGGTGLLHISTSSDHLYRP